MSASQIKESDYYTIATQKISSIQLMEKAAKAFIHGMEDILTPQQKVIVFAGRGNNGGDGLAICRLLRDRGISAVAYIIGKGPLSEDGQINDLRINSAPRLTTVADIPDLTTFDLIIDAIFGIGIQRKVVGLAAEVIERINHASAKVISVDLPSGLFPDDISPLGPMVQADLVITFQRPKLSFFFPENAPYVHQWKTVNIGLEEDHIQEMNGPYYLLDHEVRNMVIPRTKYTHKGSYGHSLLMAGSHGKMGAAILASKACLRSGTGLLTVQVPKCGYEIMQISVPEAMCLTDAHQFHLTQLHQLKPYAAIGIGPGIGTDASTALLLEQLLQQSAVPMVLDADALNLLSQNKGLLEMLRPNSILTPHPKEWERLVGKANNTLHRMDQQRSFSEKHQCVVVLKDAHTTISSPDGKIYINTSGNSGMATGGSGDVLTGIITGLLAQGYDPLAAALVGVYYHGKSGDRVTQKRGSHALIASDLIEQLFIG